MEKSLRQWSKTNSCLRLQNPIHSYIPMCKLSYRLLPFFLGAAIKRVFAFEALNKNETIDKLVNLYNPETFISTALAVCLHAIRTCSINVLSQKKKIFKHSFVVLGYMYNFCTNKVSFDLHYLTVDLATETVSNHTSLDKKIIHPGRVAHVCT